jgi:DNA-binding MarR family transcriptional regulator
VQVDEKDRRSRRLKLTSAGRRLLAEAMPLWEKAQAINEELIPGTDPERLRADLRALS